MLQMKKWSSSNNTGKIRARRVEKDIHLYGWIKRYKNAIQYYTGAAVVWPEKNIQKKVHNAKNPHDILSGSNSNVESNIVSWRGTGRWKYRK